MIENKFFKYFFITILMIWMVLVTLSAFNRNGDTLAVIQHFNDALECGVKLDTYDDIQSCFVISIS